MKLFEPCGHVKRALRPDMARNELSPLRSGAGSARICRPSAVRARDDGIDAATKTGDAVKVTYSYALAHHFVSKGELLAYLDWTVNYSKPAPLSSNLSDASPIV